MPCPSEEYRWGEGEALRCCACRYVIDTHKKCVTFSSPNFMKLINAPRPMFKSLELNFSEVGQWTWDVGYKFIFVHKQNVTFTVPVIVQQAAVDIQYINQQMHSIQYNTITKYNSWQLSNCYMLQCYSAIHVQCANLAIDCPHWYHKII